MRPLMLSAACCAVLGFASVPSFALETGKSGAEEQAIRALDRKWVEAVAATNIQAIADIYASQGMLMPPGAPPARGRAAIAEAWSAMLAPTGASLTFEPTEIVVGQGEDIAYDVGTYTHTASSPGGGTVADHGKYLVVWTREAGTWKVAADMFNSNGAAR